MSAKWPQGKHIEWALAGHNGSRPPPRHKGLHIVIALILSFTTSSAHFNSPNPPTERQTKHDARVHVFYDGGKRSLSIAVSAQIACARQRRANTAPIFLHLATAAQCGALPPFWLLPCGLGHCPSEDQVDGGWGPGEAVGRLLAPAAKLERKTLLKGLAVEDSMSAR